jgi:DNA repair exonuclease SbcCD ATPase subunit
MGLIVFELLERVANEESKQLQGVLKKFSREDFTDQLVQLQNDIEELNLQLLEVQSNIDTTGLSADQHSVEIEQLNTQKLPVPSNVPSKEVLVSNQASLVKKIDVLTTNLVILEQEEKDIEAQFTSVKEKLNDVNLTELEQNYKKYQELERNLSKLEQTYTLASTNIDSKHQTIEQLSTFNYNPDCEVCVENNKSKLERITEITNHINELTEKSTELAEQITIIKLEMDTLKPDHDKFISAKNLVDIYQKLNVDLQGSRNNIDKSKNRLDTLNADLSNVEVQFEELDKYASALVTNRQVDEKILVHKEELQKIKSTLRDLHDNKMDLHSSVKVKESSRSNIMEQLNEIAQIEKEFEAYRYYMDAVGKDGIPYQLISKTIPVIEGEINNILSQIVPFSIALDVDGKNFGGRIVYDHERSWPLENSSGMERFISSLAIRVALLKASNLPKSNFLIIDEGMGSLDSEYLHGMQLMFDLLKAQFDYVVVISHLDNIRDMVDNIIEIKTVNGYSHINTMN